MLNLMTLKNHLACKKFLSLGALCAQFQEKPETLRSLLNYFLQKGCVRVCKKTPNCGSQCFKCETIFTEYYEWLA